MKELDELFPFEYRGGGYFRLKGVPVGKNAEILHGMEAVEYLYKKMIKRDKIFFGEIPIRTEIVVLGPDAPRGSGCLPVWREEP